MKILVAIDSFKGSLTSLQAGQAVCEGIKRVSPGDEVNIVPIADGGEGTLEALSACLNAEKIAVSVHNPLGRMVKAQYGIVPSGNKALIEMSAAAGIEMISREELNPLNTTTFGVGELIKDAINRGCRNFIIGLGGSATNDGGIGMLQALGFGILDSKGEQVPYGAKALASVSQINFDSVMPEIEECKFLSACDVDNPLCGENGCSAVFAPQKGADKESVSQMDMWMNKYADTVEKILGVDYRDVAGAGAAGGMGFALKAFLGADIISGINLIIQETHLEEKIKNCDIVITGEGKLDGQSVHGKVPVGIAHLAKKYGKKVVAFAGCVGDGVEKCIENGIDEYFTISDGLTPEESMKSDVAFRNLADKAEAFFKKLQ